MNGSYPMTMEGYDQLKKELKHLISIERPEVINAIAEAAGTSVENIVRRACFHNDLQWFAESIEEWASYFPSDKPASTTIGLNDSMILEGANTLLDLIAYVPNEGK